MRLQRHAEGIPTALLRIITGHLRAMPCLVGPRKMLGPLRRPAASVIAVNVFAAVIYDELLAGPIDPGTGVSLRLHFELSEHRRPHRSRSKLVPRSDSSHIPSGDVTVSLQDGTGISFESRLHHPPRTHKRASKRDRPDLGHPSLLVCRRPSCLTGGPTAVPTIDDWHGHPGPDIQSSGSRPARPAAAPACTRAPRPNEQRHGRTRIGTLWRGRRGWLGRAGQGREGRRGRLVRRRTRLEACKPARISMRTGCGIREPSNLGNPEWDHSPLVVRFRDSPSRGNVTSSLPRFTC